MKKILVLLFIIPIFLLAQKVPEHTLSKAELDKKGEINRGWIALGLGALLIGVPCYFLSKRANYLLSQDEIANEAMNRHLATKKAKYERTIVIPDEGDEVIRRSVFIPEPEDYSTHTPSNRSTNDW